MISQGASDLEDNLLNSGMILTFICVRRRLISLKVLFGCFLILSTVQLKLYLENAPKLREYYSKD